MERYATEEMQREHEWAVEVGGRPCCAGCQGLRYEDAQRHATWVRATQAAGPYTPGAVQIVRLPA